MFRALARNSGKRPSRIATRICLIQASLYRYRKLGAWQKRR
jgi:hypothetical protein